MHRARTTVLVLFLIAPAASLLAQDSAASQPAETRPAAATRPESRPAEARGKHPRIGVRCDAVALEKQGVARVEAVVAGSPAERAGIKVGDVITKIGDDEIRDDKSYRDSMSRRKAGEAVPLTIRRGGQMLDLVVTLPERSTFTEPESIVIQHVLIGCGPQAPTPAGKSRTVEQARKLAEEIAVKAKNGADFGELVKSYSEDTGSVKKTPPGSYGLVQDGKPKPTPDTYEKSGFVLGFSWTAFMLDVGDVGISAYDPDLSPYGFHVIKRIK